MSDKSKKEIPLFDITSEKMKVKVKSMSKFDMESSFIAKAIKEGESGELIDTDLFLKSIIL